MGRSKRSDLWRPDEIAVVHCVQWCGRGAFLAGFDPASGRDHRARRDWIRHRLQALASVFAVDVLAFAIMPDHLHVVLRTRPDQVANWGGEETARRWLSVFPGRRTDAPFAPPTEKAIQLLADDALKLSQTQGRLSDISWFMRALSEPIARMANRQESARGAFWEGRFKAQRITDPFGALACAAYVDLNPLRAGLARSPGDDPGTGAFVRLQESASDRSASRAVISDVPAGSSPVATGAITRPDRRPWLAPIVIGEDAWPTTAGAAPSKSAGVQPAGSPEHRSLSTTEYLPILHWVAAQTTADPSVGPPAALEKSLSAWRIAPDVLADVVWNFGTYFGTSSCVGSPTSMSSYAQQTGRRWVRGQGRARERFAGGPPSRGRSLERG